MMTQRIIAPTLDEIRMALRLEGFDSPAAHRRMAPRIERQLPQRIEEPARQAAVLILLYPSRGGIHFMLTRRSESLSKHRGQISLPGGSSDPTDRDTGETALREAHEEIAVRPEDVDLIGELASLYIPNSNFQVFPHVGFIGYRPHFIAAEEEVAALIEVPLVALLDDASKRLEAWDFSWGTSDIPYYLFSEQIIWGATAMILSDFEGRIKAL